MPKTKALIVEDEVIIAEDIRQILISIGYEVVGIATKYSRAIEMLRTMEVDFVLIDIILGGAKSGIDLAADINEHHKIPFIFLTSHADAATVKRAKEVKPNAYLLKPFTRDDIFATLEIALTEQVDDKYAQAVSELSEREIDVYKALAEGNTDQEIADSLFISLNTVKTHLKSIYKKLDVRNRLEAVSMANRI